MVAILRKTKPCPHHKCRSVTRQIPMIPVHGLDPRRIAVQGRSESSLAYWCIQNAYKRNRFTWSIGFSGGHIPKLSCSMGSVSRLGDGGLNLCGCSYNHGVTARGSSG